MKGTKNIIIKELTRVFTDRKMVISLFILPAFIVIGLYSLMGQVMKNMLNDIEEHIPSVYIQNAPEDLQQVISDTQFQGDITYLGSSESTDEIKEGILQGTVDLLVVFEEGFRETINSYQLAGDAIPEVKTYYNSAEDYSSVARESFVYTVLDTYQKNIQVERLGNTEQLQVFYIDKDPTTSNIVDEKKEDGKFFGSLLPFLINVMLFSGAMGLGVDAITGEKERGTLASMLLSPIKRSEIVFGKLISLAILSGISAVVYAVSIVFAIPMMYSGITGGATDGARLHFTAVEAIQLLVLLIVLVYLYVGLVALVAVYAKTSKVANTYVMPIYILIMLGSILTVSGMGDSKLTNFFIPIYNSAICIQNLLLGELTMAQFGATVGTIAILAIIVTQLITRAFNSEKIMFNA
ncbi:ABC transporter permease [Lachnospiraceae bacterium MD1]|uniref:ABC transporter permease n=1 Tax=Variimorphobacter saccharofermentans TaxID=2755051 RepID=A0A839K3U0_9FIRM|nr:ABC transporter permease [Variimorphobacter saccharofermentans]MBB2184534.1 ABC transporter permease [Variimorphobacter saccharofermentans]